MGGRWEMGEEMGDVRGDGREMGDVRGNGRCERRWEGRCERRWEGDGRENEKMKCALYLHDER
jgi:hypothetical protein